MKLIIQIPCLNESQNLEKTINDLPKSIKGIDEIEILVIDDGSTDNTAEIAEQIGVDYVLRLGTNRGLAIAFKSGIEYALQLGADIVVNTDADNQYYGGDVSKLVKPILDKRADMVVGCRPIIDHPEFSLIKKIIQILGSWTLRIISKTQVKDAASGFRAFSREFCQRIFIHSKFSYCMETLIQAGNTGLRVASVDIDVNSKTRESRLFKSTYEYVIKSGATIFTMSFLYRPGRFFFTIGSTFFVLAFALGVRFLWFKYFTSDFSGGKTQSLILLSIFAFGGISAYSLAILGELLKANRKILEEILSRDRRFHSGNYENKSKSDE